jgi:hypothetical protein
MKPGLPIALACLLAASGASDVSVEARYEPPAHAGGQALIVARLLPRNPDLRVNELPAPRLRLEAGGVLVDRQPAPTPHVPLVDPEFAKYLDTSQPVRFAVEPDPKAAPGTYVVPASVSFAYCSKQQGWCKKGKERIEVSVTIR